MPKMSRQKLVVGGIGLVITAGLIGLYVLAVRGSSGTITTDSVSDRAQEFVASQQETGTSEWNRRDLDDQGLSNAPTFQTFGTDCFSVTVPYATVNQKTRSSETACVFEARVLKPPTQLVIRSEKNQSPLSEISGLQMRLKDPQTYQLQKTQFSSFDTTHHFIAQDAVTVFLTKDGRLVTVAFNFSGTQQEIDPALLAALVDSIRLTN